MVVNAALEGSVPGARLSEDKIDLHIGRRLRRRRRLLGLTMESLAGATGVRFQQIQKYECAGNRLLASRLFRLAAALHVPVQYFYDGLPQDGATAAPANDRELAPADHLASEESQDILEAFAKLPAQIRRKLRDFAKSLSGDLH